MRVSLANLLIKHCRLRRGNNVEQCTPDISTRSGEGREVSYVDIGENRLKKSLNKIVFILNRSGYEVSLRGPTRGRGQANSSSVCE